MLIAVNQMKTSHINAQDADLPWTNFDIVGSLPNLKVELYDNILRSLGWRPEATVANNITTIPIRACAIICASDSLIIYVGGYCSDIMAYTYDSFDQLDLNSFVKEKLSELIQAKAAQLDSRKEIAWQGLTAAFECNEGFDTNDKGQLIYSRACSGNKHRTIDFPVITRLESTEHYDKPVPKTNSIDFLTYLNEAFVKEFGAVIEAYFNQQMAIASRYLGNVPDHDLSYHYVEAKESVTNTSIFYLGFSYDMPGSPVPIEVMLIIDQSAVDLNTGKLNKMSEIILRSV